MQTLDKAGLLNFVANQPEVLAGIAPGYAMVDMGQYMDQPGTFFVGDEHGLILFVYIGDGVYESHYMMTNSLTTQEKMKLCRRALKEVFTTHNAWAINGTTPRGNMAARCLNRALGLRPVGPATDTLGRRCIKYRLEKASWVP